MFRWLTFFAFTLLLSFSIGCKEQRSPASPPTNAATRSVVATPATDSAGLLSAAGEGNTARVKELLGQGANPNVRGADGRSPLMEAAYGGHLEIFRLLLDKGARVDFKKDDGATALSFAQGRNDQVMVEMLLQIDRLIEAAGRGDETAVRTQLEKGASVNAGGADGRTALMEAAYGGHKEIVKLLLEKGADVKAKKDDGADALSLTKPGASEIKTMLKERSD